jgi:hypothetical protein
MPERVLALNRRDRLHHVCSTDGLRARLREAEVLHLALGDELLHRTGDLLDGHLRVDTVLIEEVDRIDPKPPERRFGRSTAVRISEIISCLAAGGP